MSFKNIEIDSTSKSSQDIIFIIREDNLFLDVITSNEDLLYKKKQDIIEHTIEEVFDDKTYVELFSNFVKNTLTTNKAITIRYNLSVMAGVDLYFEATCSPLSILFDSKKAVTITIKNVTEKIETEKALKTSKTNFQSIYETANAGIAIKNEHGHYIACNKAFADLLEYTETELSTIHFTQLLDADHQEKNIQLYTELTEKNTYTVENKFITKSGKTFWGSLHVSAIPDDSGMPMHCISVLVDITDRKMHEELLTNLNHTKDKFFSIISHDLQNPLIGIIGLSEILKNSIDTIEHWERDKIIRWILEGGQTASNLLMNLLEWSRSQTNQIDFKPSELNLYEVTEKNISLIRNFAEGKKITISNSIPADLNVWIDLNIISTIVRNLIANAIKFTHENGTIAIDCAVENDMCRLSIKDSGIGMSTEQIDRLFDLKNKFTTLGTYNEKGTGLGLILCKEFIDKYNGKIWVTSEINKGTTFNFTIPLRDKAYTADFIY